MGTGAATKRRKTGAAKAAAAAPAVSGWHAQFAPPADADLSHIHPEFRAFAVRTDSLKRDPANARVHGEADLPSTMNSLRRFGQQHLLHCDPETRVIKVGNGRHEAAERLAETDPRWKYIAALPSNLPANELRAFALADNRTAEKSKWDPDALRREIDALDELAVPIDDVGFADGDIAELEKQLAAELEEDETLRLKPRRKKQDQHVAVTDNPTVLIICRDDGHQRELLERFKEEGLDCRAR